MNRNKKKKIAYISGTRADFGLMTSILYAIKKSPKLDLQIYATGIHLMPEFGKTVRDVLGEFPRAKIINSIFKTDGRLGAAEFSGNFLQKLIAVFKKDQPDFVLTLGDRPEMLCVALACLYLGIPTGQLHAGDRSSTVDELARHAITKLSQLNFPATKEAAARVIKMGEDAWRTHVVGAPALDVILRGKLFTRAKLFKDLDLNFKGRFILLTQHPVSEDWQQAGEQAVEVISAVESVGLPVVVVYPHADAGGRKIIKEIEKRKNNPLFHIFKNIPHKKFLSLEREAAVWVGNSSGLMIESASFKIPVVNVGDRQAGRQHGENVINVGYDRKEIESAIRKSLDDRNYIEKLKKIKNPWGDGKSAGRIVRILENLNIDKKLLAKKISY
ncbi:MAG: UDP-N-acetylglucosamine 2-epimerase [bacterium]|nr:UDP-N-acetylglucosamine 2-epimerase [bacterium]